MEVLRRPAIVHRTMRFLGPVTEPTATELVEALDLPREPRILDAATGDAAWADKARARWGGTVETVRDPEEWLAGRHGWVGGLDPYDLVLDLGAPAPDATVYDHLVAAREVLKPGGKLLLGTGYWRLPATRAYLAKSGFRRGAMSGLGATFAHLHENGFRLREWSASPPDAWDAYEEAFRDRIVAWAEQDPENPAARAARHLAEERYRLFRCEGRYVLGFALLLAEAR